MNANKFFSVFFISIAMTCMASLYALVHDVIGGVKVLHINSLKQTIKDKNSITFEGQVEILIDQRLHVWADQVIIDKAQQTLRARGQDGRPVSLEDNTFFMLADSLLLNVAQKTGRADNLRLHIDEGYIAAKKAEKLNDTDWEMEDMTYTACNASHPHWKITAGHAKLYKTYLVKGTNILFKVAGLPILGLPCIIFPIQGRSKSGFLMPRFSYDYEYGFGFKQDYYKWISPHCDTTLGFNWRSKRGVVFSDEFRWARSKDSYTLIDGKYGVVNNAYSRKDNFIERITQRRYWVQGKDFQEYDAFIGEGKLNTLMRFDFGTDKNLGYHFFNNTSDVDDTFYNTCTGRLSFPLGAVSLTAEVEKTVRKNFSHKKEHVDGSVQRVTKEVEDRVHLTKLPHLEWNAGFRCIADRLMYRHDIFVDQVLHRHEGKEVLYVGKSLKSEKSIMPLSKADLIRFNYAGNIKSAARFFGTTLSLYARPRFQVTSQLNGNCSPQKNVLERKSFGRGAYRLFAEYGAEWALPEMVTYSPDYCYYYAMQPVLSWEFLPKFYQDHWFYFDKYDRAYPKNAITVALRSGLSYHDHHVSLDIRQGYDFYASHDRFPLRRGLDEKHLLPCGYDVYYDSTYFHCGVSQEFEWKNFVLLQSNMNVGLHVGKVDCQLSYFFQKPQIQDHRGLLANIPHFFGARCSIPCGDHGSLVYDGQFYAKQKSHPFALEGITPLIHRLRFEYKGHCWGFYLGFEQKKYKELGLPRNERSIVFSLSLDSIGSFAKKFKKPFTWKN